MSRVLTGAFTLLAALGWSTSAGAVPIVSVDADPTLAGIQSTRSVDLGDSFTVDVVVSGVDVTAPLNGYDVTLGYAPGVLAATSAVDGGFLLAPSLNFLTALGPPQVQVVQSTLLPAGAAGAGVLATVTFDALLAGSSGLDLLGALLTAPFGVPITGVTTANATIDVVDRSTVPEPPVVALLLAGVLLLGRRARSG